MELTVEIVNNTVRPSFEKNVDYVREFLKGTGADMGCGSCPLINPPCEFYVDISPQPVAVEQVSPLGKEFIHGDLRNVILPSKVDFIFSSHALEDLGSEQEIKETLYFWSTFVVPGGYIVLLMPDMEGGRYPKVGEEGGNCSHHVNVGVNFMTNLLSSSFLSDKLKIIQTNTIPYKSSETFDFVVRKNA